jgi:hypothetical protein
MFGNQVQISNFSFSLMLNVLGSYELSTRRPDSNTRTVAVNNETLSLRYLLHTT